MRKESENGNLDQPCFVQTVRFSLKLPSRGGISPHTGSVELNCARLMSGCVHCDIDTETLQTGDERETW